MAEPEPPMPELAVRSASPIRLPHDAESLDLSQYRIQLFAFHGAFVCCNQGKETKDRVPIIHLERNGVTVKDILEACLDHQRIYHSNLSH